jgi:hypothetical protein
MSKMTNKTQTQKSQINQTNPKEGGAMFNSIKAAGWMKGILGVIATFVVIAGLSAATYAQLPDLTITRIDLQFPTLYGFVSNIGDATPRTNVVVGAWVDIYNCYTGQSATLKGAKKFRGSFFTPGKGGWVNFGIRLKRGWIITKVTMAVDPFNQIYEYSGANNEIYMLVNSYCPDAESAPRVGSAGEGNNSAAQLSGPEAGREVHQTQVEIFTLDGQKVSQRTTSSSSMTVEELSRALPNGVYIYTLTHRGVNGEIVKKEVRKLTIVK